MERRSRNAKRKSSDLLGAWSLEDSLDLYGIERWSQGMFTANSAGNLCLASPGEAPGPDLARLTAMCRDRGIALPVLLRFPELLQRRLSALHDAFTSAMETTGYDGGYRGVYPIKVNQHRRVVEDVVRFGAPYHYGLEAGSKAELLIAIALNQDPESLIVCNGFKDRLYVETALHATRLGKHAVLVIEKPSELALILDVAKAMGVRPHLGIRLKLASRGKGMWGASGGDRSKFGLTADEVLDVVVGLRKRRRLECLELIHYHIGSQIPDIQRIKNALREASRWYVEIRALGAPIAYLDVGGGMAVDYDGSRTNYDSSANYGLAEYATDVVEAVGGACQESGLPRPCIVSETGRAISAFHSVLVVEAIGSQSVLSERPLPKVTQCMPDLLHRLKEAEAALSPRNFQETYHDAMDARREALVSFNLGHLSLAQRAAAERYFWRICRRIHEILATCSYVPDDLDGLEVLMATTYTCNFSVFQSLPDHWALKQLFPIAPLQRLHERPSVHAILGDLTCDSDGLIDAFVDLKDSRRTLRLHPLKAEEPYYIGIFLVGAYQEILGDMHNLFGDTSVVHVLSGGDELGVDEVIEGDSIQRVLEAVKFSEAQIIDALEQAASQAREAGTVSASQVDAALEHIRNMLGSSTYIEPSRPR